MNGKHAQEAATSSAREFVDPPGVDFSELISIAYLFEQ